MTIRLMGDNRFTFPHDFLDFLRMSERRPHRVGDYELDPACMARFNGALHELNPEAPEMTMDQIASAAERALAREPEHSDMPPFVASRMAALARLESMAADADWGASEDLRHKVDVLIRYRKDTGDLIPDTRPVVGLLDDAVLVDVALQLLRGELADYEDFCRFRKVAAEFAGLPEGAAGFTRAHWLQAIVQDHANVGRSCVELQDRAAGDPRASLFHVT